MKLMGIFAVVVVLIGLGVGGWLWVSNKPNDKSSQSVTESQTAKLTISPTVKITPTDTPVVGNYQSGGLFINVVSPKNGEIIKTTSVKVSGKTKPGVDVGINEKDVTADREGNFSGTVSLESGENEIIVVATDESGNVAEQSIKVSRE